MMIKIYAAIVVFLAFVGTAQAQIGGSGGPTNTLSPSAAPNGSILYNNNGLVAGYTLGNTFVSVGGALTLATGAASFNIGPLSGDICGMLPSPTLCSGAAAKNLGAATGALTGSWPNLGLNSSAAIAAIGIPGGDVQGTSYKATIVAGLQGFPIDPTPPSAQTALVYNGIKYIPTSVAPGITALTGAISAGPGSGTQTTSLNMSTVGNANLVQSPALTIKGNPTAAPASVTDFPVGGGLAFAGSALGLAPSGVTSQSITVGSDCWTIGTTGQVISISLATSCTSGAQLTADDGATVLTADDGVTPLTVDGGGSGNTPCSTNLVGDFSDVTGCNLMFKMALLH